MIFCVQTMYHFYFLRFSCDICLQINLSVHCYILPFFFPLINYLYVTGPFSQISAIQLCSGNEAVRVSIYNLIQPNLVTISALSLHCYSCNLIVCLLRPCVKCMFLCKLHCMFLCKLHCMFLCIFSSFLKLLLCIKKNH